MTVNRRNWALPCAVAACCVAGVGGCCWVASSWPRNGVARLLRRAYRALPSVKKPFYEFDTPLVWSEPPECQPLTNVTQLLTWQPPCPPSEDPRACTVPLQPVATPTSGDPRQAARPKLLVCHDMAGGYQDDRHPQGADNPNYYSIWHWDCVDVFVYFSHSLVTVPPVGWITAAHRHGVQVLGTFITEWEGGAARCTRMFSSREAAQRVAEQLVAITKHYGFEGWLINIENGLSSTEVHHTLHFLSYLRARLHAEVPHAMLMWYDAVTVDGKLIWQNTLNDSNYPFFDVTDAIFINYGWRPAQAAAMAFAAGGRRSQVYAGVDVFGRGTYGGGGWDSNVGLAAAKAEGLSAALFAPGWVSENLPREDFQENQEAYWQKVSTAWGYGRLRLQQLPFTTCFNQGQGYTCFKAGSVEPTPAAGAAAPWWDLQQQELLLPLHGRRSSGPPLAVQLIKETAWEGGTCLSLKSAPGSATGSSSGPAAIAAGSSETLGDTSGSSWDSCNSSATSSSSSGALHVVSDTSSSSSGVSCIELLRLAPSLARGSSSCGQVLEVRVVCAAWPLQHPPAVQLAVWVKPAASSSSSQGTAMLQASTASSAAAGSLPAVQQQQPSTLDGSAEEVLLLLSLPGQPGAPELQQGSAAVQPPAAGGSTPAVATSTAAALSCGPQVERLGPVHWVTPQPSAAAASEPPDAADGAASAAAAAATVASTTNPEVAPAAAADGLPARVVVPLAGACWHRLTWQVALQPLQQQGWAIMGLGVGWAAAAASAAGGEAAEAEAAATEWGGGAAAAAKGKGKGIVGPGAVSGSACGPRVPQPPPLLIGQLGVSSLQQGRT